jgi:mono/diheme cytochrome c family protein
MTSRDPITGGLLLLSWGLAAMASGCWGLPSAHTISRNYRFGEAPVDPPGADACGYEDTLRGGRIFQMYCGACHNARALGERPFSNYEVASAHMREQAYLTGKEYRQLIHFLRRWHDVGPPTADVEPSPKRLYFSQPISELRPKPPEGTAPPPRLVPPEPGGASPAIPKPEGEPREGGTGNDGPSLP